jgi:hypothetical protein
MDALQQGPMACIARQAWQEVPQDPAPACQATTIKAPVFTLDTCYNVMDLKIGRYVVTSSLRCKRPSLGRAQRNLIASAASQTHLKAYLYVFMSRKRWHAALCNGSR